MNEAENLAKTVAGNLVALRKAKGLTQQELSDKLSYSDKSVSKWERGAAIPRVEILKEIAEFYGVSVDYLLIPHEEKDVNLTNKELRRKANWIVTTAMMFCFVWTIASVIYGALLSQGTENAWVSFCYAIPVSAGTVLWMINKYMGHQNWIFLTIASIALWTILLAFYLNFLALNLWYIFLAGIPVQAMVYLFTKYQR